MNLATRFLEPPSGSFFLFGPRGTGKTTWLKNRFEDATYFDLLRPQVHRQLAARPERLAEAVAARPEAVTVVDEVQRLPELLNVVHALIEEYPKARFVLTGSSARKLRRGGVDLLGGRAALRSMHPFMAAELGSFDLDSALRHGMLPLVVAADDPAEVLDAYVSLYIDQEVRAEAAVRNIGDFARFVEVLSFSHGALLNVAAVAREAEVQRKTAAGYVDLLEDLLLGYRVPVFSRRAKRRAASHPKFYLFDAGVFRSVRPMGPLDRPVEAEGPALEGLVMQHLRAWCAYSSNRHKLYFWRTAAGSEVDCVVYGDTGLWAFEVKNGTRVHRTDLRHLRAFRADYPESEVALLYRGDRELLIDGIRCLPVEGFLPGVRPNDALL